MGLYDVKAKLGEFNRTVSGFSEFITKAINAENDFGVRIDKLSQKEKSLEAEIASLEAHKMELKKSIETDHASQSAKIETQLREALKSQNDAAIVLKDAQNIKSEALKFQAKLNAEKEEHESKRKAFEAKVEKMKELTA